MKKIVLILILILSVNCLSQTSWVNLYNSNNEILSLYFINNNTGFASCYGGYVLKTTNGGANWSQSQISAEFLWHVIFTDSLIGYIASGNTKTTCLLFKTTNAGINWFPIASSATHIQCVFFVDANTGYFPYNSGTSYSAIKKTKNGGVSWNQYITNYLPNSLFFLNANTGFGACAYGNVIKTTNGGVNWVTWSTGTTQYLNSVLFLNGLTGFVTGNGGFIGKTTDGGYNWSQFTYQNYWLQSVFFVDNNTGYVSGANGTILRTTNSGDNWVLQPTSTNQTLYSIQFTSRDTGYAAGGLNILKTTNGGVTFISPVSNENSDKFLLQQNYPNPFNPSTIIGYQLNVKTHVDLNVYDDQGRLAKKLIDQTQNAGNYRINFDGSDLPSGVYFYELVTDGFTETKKMVLIK